MSALLFATDHPHSEGTFPSDDVIHIFAAFARSHSTPMWWDEIVDQHYITIHPLINRTGRELHSRKRIFDLRSGLVQKLQHVCPIFCGQPIAS